MMKSPFPGMDPYLEEFWPEVHARLIVYASNQVNRQLPEDLQANIEECLTVLADDEARGIRPDIHLAEEHPFDPSQVQPTAVAISEPILVKRPPHAERHIEIVSRSGRVITAIEFISPWNKIGTRSQNRYLEKQLAYLNAGINLVEIDLVTQGSYVLAAPPEDLAERLRTPYMVCVFRQVEPDQFEIYRAKLQERLPNIPVPLRDGELDVALELQKLIDECYQDGRYYRLSYQDNPKARFDDEQAAWLDAHLKAQGRRN